MANSGTTPWALMIDSPCRRAVQAAYTKARELEKARDRRDRIGQLAHNLSEIQNVAKSPDDIKGIAAQLVRFADWLHAMAEVECNGVPRRWKVGECFRFEATWDTEDAQIFESTNTSIRRAISIALEGFGVTQYKIEGDPRGNALTLFMPHGRWNKSGGGWAV